MIFLALFSGFSSVGSDLSAQHFFILQILPTFQPPGNRSNGSDDWCAADESSHIYILRKPGALPASSLWPGHGELPEMPKLPKSPKLKTGTLKATPCLRSSALRQRVLSLPISVISVHQR